MLFSPGFISFTLSPFPSKCISLISWFFLRKGKKIIILLHSFAFFPNMGEKTHGQKSVSVFLFVAILFLRWRLCLEFGYGLCRPESKTKHNICIAAYTYPGTGRVCKILSIARVLSAAWGKHQGHLHSLSFHLGPWVSFLERDGSWEGI